MEQLSQWVQDLEKSFQGINYWGFAINFIVTALLSALIAVFYTRFGSSSGNRRKFARTFIPLAMTTMLIIFIVKGSVALSLGLVGALSIVRFRAAIKEPEELIYLFLNIGVGLAAGAGQIAIGAAAVIFILAVLLVQARLRGVKSIASADKMYLNISTSLRDIQAISDILTAIFQYVELRRADDDGNRMEISFLIEAANIKEMEKARNELLQAAADTRISFIEQRDIAV